MLRQLPASEGLLFDLDLDSNDSARKWLVTEQSGLIVLAGHARGTGHPEAAAWLAHVLAGHLDSQAYWSEAHELHQASAAYWRSVPNDRREARALIDLGATLANASRYPAAQEALQRGLALARADQDDDATAEALSLLGGLLWHQSSWSRQSTSWRSPCGSEERAATSGTPRAASPTSAPSKIRSGTGRARSPPTKQPFHWRGNSRTELWSSAS